MHFTPEFLGTLAIQAIGLAMGWGMLLQKVKDHERRITHVEQKIDKWQEDGIGVKLQATKAHSAHN